MQEERIDERDEEFVIGKNSKNPRPIYVRFSADFVLMMLILMAGAYGVFFAVKNGIGGPWDDRGTPVVIRGDKGDVVSFTAKDGSEVHVTVLPSLGGK